MLKIVLVAHLTYENQWGKLRTKIQTFVFWDTLGVSRGLGLRQTLTRDERKMLLGQIKLFQVPILEIWVRALEPQCTKLCRKGSVI